jgi:acyl-CoA hydrolase
MTIPIQQKIRDKTITAKQWAEMVSEGDWIIPGTVGGDSTACVEELGLRLGEGRGQLKNIELWLQVRPVPMYNVTDIDPGEKYHTSHEIFFMPWERKQRDEHGSIDWNQWAWSLGSWSQFYRWYNKEKSKRAIDWFIVAVSPPEFGYFNFSYGTNEALMFSKCAKRVVVEVRQDYAWCEPGANNIIHVDDVDYIVEVDCEKYRWPQMSEPEPGPVENEIAQNCLSMMDNGDCIQLGIGALPTAMARGIAKAGLRHLGVHTEMMNDGLMALIESGSVDNSLKPIDRGRSVWTFAFPFNWKRYYDFIHRNPALAVYDVTYTNNAGILSRIDNMVAINSCVAIDLYGQLVAGHYAGRPISSSGGFWDFVTWCQTSKGGRSIVAITSRSKQGTPRIVPQLPPGSVVDVPAHTASWVTTEYGIVCLRGLSGYERAKALISIAHPDDREYLEKEAYRLNLIPRKFPVLMWPSEKRRYPDFMKERKGWKIPYNSVIWGYDFIDDGWSGK